MGMNQATAYIYMMSSSQHDSGVKNSTKKIEATNL